MTDEGTTVEEITDEIGRALGEVDKAHRAKIEKLTERIDALETELAEAKDSLKADEEEREEEFGEMERALYAVREWMHEPLHCGMPMRDPRKILLIVERALDIP